MTDNSPNCECPVCHSRSWEWHEYIQMTGWRCGTCEVTIIQADSPTDDVQCERPSAEGESIPRSVRKN